MIAICQLSSCGKEFEAKRSTAKYCCAAHRVDAHRSQAALKKQAITDQRLFETLLEMPVARLQAIYNDSSRKLHNDIKPRAHSKIMALVATVCGFRSIKISGDIGTYEFFKK